MDAAKMDGVKTAGFSPSSEGMLSKSAEVADRKLVTENHCPGAKRSKTDSTNAEAELPLALQLSISFLAAGDLGKLAAVNRAGRKAAVASYLQRSRTPRDTDGSSSTQLPLQQAIGRQPNQFKWGNPWSCLGATSNNIWAAKCLNANDYACSNWDIEWKQHHDGILQARRAKFHVPNDLLLPQMNRRHKVIHCSLVQDSLLVIAIKKYLPPEAIRQGEEEDEVLLEMEYDDEEEHAEMKKDIWAVLYNIISSPTAATVAKDDECIHYPSLAERIKGPIPKACYYDYEDVKLGSTCRSGNGNMFGTVTQLPDDQEKEDDAQVSIYEISKTTDNVQDIRLVQDLDAEMFNLTYDYSNIDISMSADGSVVSILNQEMYHDSGGWIFYLRNSDGIYQELVEINARFSHYVIDAFYTVDQDFVMATRISPEWLEEWLEETTIPKVVARRFLIYGENQCT